jgi:hypothetical protein
MTIFASTASPGRRWKMFLPGAASTPGGVISLGTAPALIRNRWLNADARRPQRRKVAGGQSLWV